MKKTILMSAIAALGFMGTAQAHNHGSSCDHSGVSFDHVSGYYGQSDVTGADMDEISLEAQRSIGNGVFVEALFSQSELDATPVDVEVDTFALGLGYAHQVNKKTSFYGALGALKVDSDQFPEGVDDDGYYAAVGAKHMMFKKFEVDGRLTRTDVLDNSDNDFSLTGKYYIHKDWTVNARYTFDAKVSSVGVSYHF